MFLVTEDDYSVIFHDNFIGGEDKGVFKEQRVTDITLLELLSYGPQKEAGKCQPVKTFSGNFIVHHWTRNGNLYIVSMPFRDPLRPLVLGGDHSISYPVVRAVSEKLVGPVDIYKPLEGKFSSVNTFPGGRVAHVQYANEHGLMECEAFDSRHLAVSLLV
ncbi:arginase [Prunus dulcis]|uniref:Arginase n=1 Tax=Prunus dulcis TaxID=3755 RepID=A0A4Y1QZW4_PRUDU|nr:arginase [Prunus dulcis]